MFSLHPKSMLLSLLFSSKLAEISRKLVFLLGGIF
jgi:hypothetical protein